MQCEENAENTALYASFKENAVGNGTRIRELLPCEALTDMLTFKDGMRDHKPDGASVMLHAFIKKSGKTPTNELTIARARLKDAKANEDT